MKKTAAILLMGLLAFNWVGYQVAHRLLEARADSRLEAALDARSYDEASLISFKIPATHLAYYNPSLQFERVDGQVEVDGIRYKYVKRRLYNDSVELLCIPNSASMQLRTARDEFFRLVNDLQHDSQGKKQTPGPAKSFSTTDYYIEDAQVIACCLYAATCSFGLVQVGAPVSPYGPAAEQPPDLI